MAAHLHLARTSAGAGNSYGPALPIRVVLADGHAVVRRSLRLLLDSEADVDVIAEAADVPTVVRIVHRGLPHVLVHDLRLPSGSGIETIRRLRAEVPETEVVALTMEQSPLSAQQAMDAGAIGFVLKDRADSELLSAVRSAARGEEYVSARVAAGLDVLRRAADGGPLTPRELEILRLIALGHTSTEIAGKLRLSRRTVETHRARIHEKLDVRTRAELVQFALGRRLIGV